MAAKKERPNGCETALLRALQQIATVCEQSATGSAVIPRLKQFATDCNNQRLQSPIQTAQNPVVEHKDRMRLWVTSRLSLWGLCASRGMHSGRFASRLGCAGSGKKDAERRPNERRILHRRAHRRKLYPHNVILPRKGRIFPLLGLWSDVNLYRCSLGHTARLLRQIGFKSHALQRTACPKVPEAVFAPQKKWFLRH